jgi:hypothetical protein
VAARRDGDNFPVAGSAHDTFRRIDRKALAHHALREDRVGYIRERERPAGERRAEDD